MRKVSLDELLSFEGLAAKQYAIIETGHDSGGYCLEVEIQAKGCVGSELYVASRRVRQDVREKCWKLDDVWLPYIEASVGSQTIMYYDRLFLGNTSFATAMAKMHQDYVFQILEEVKKEQHPLYRKFQEDLSKIIEETQCIKEAKDRKHYFGDGAFLQKYSKCDLLIFEYLCTKKMRFKLGSSEYDPDNYCTEQIDLSDKQHVDCVAGKTKGEAAFLVWYGDYLRKNGYEKKIERGITGGTYSQKVERAFRAHVETLTKPLAERYFEKVKHLSYD